MLHTPYPFKIILYVVYLAICISLILFLSILQRLSLPANWLASCMAYFSKFKSLTLGRTSLARLTDKLITSFYEDRLSYACFKINHVKYDIFLNKKDNLFYISYNDYWKSFKDYDELWLHFADSIKDMLPDKYDNFLRYMKMKTIIDEE